MFMDMIGSGGGRVCGVGFVRRGCGDCGEVEIRKWRGI